MVPGSFFIGTLTNTSKKDHEPNEFTEHVTNAESSENESQRTADLETSTPIEKDQSVNLKDDFSVLAVKLDTLQNFFLTESSGIKAGIKK